MIEFRDHTAKKYGIELLEYINEMACGGASIPSIMAQPILPL